MLLAHLQEAFQSLFQLFRQLAIAGDVAGFQEVEKESEILLRPLQQGVARTLMNLDVPARIRQG